MNKNDIINDVVAGLTLIVSEEQLQIVKATFVCKMQGYEIHPICTLPSTEIINNDFIFKRFAVDQIAKGTKEPSVTTYLNILRLFFNYVRKDFREVTSQDITDYLAVKKVTRNARGRLPAQNYISTTCRVLFVFFQWSYRKHHIDEDIMRDVDRIKPKQKKKERLTPEETEACRDICKTAREKALFEFMLCTGARVGEIARLRIEEIDFQAKRLNIHGEKSDAADRVGFLSIRARNAIQEYIGNRRSGYVFRPRRNVIEDDKQISNGSLERLAKDIGERAGVHCITTIHIYRKTFASETYRKTKDVKLVSILLGHSSTAVTEKYYLVDDMRDIEYQAINAVA